MKNAITIYLNKINPFVALFIFLWCSWIYFGPFIVSIIEQNSIMSEFKKLFDGEENGISMYIFVKGIFCSLMLWLVGEYFKHYFAKNNQ
jgi:hypothetical protein